MSPLPMSDLRLQPHPDCRNFNGGFNRFLRPDWSAAGDGFGSTAGIKARQPSGRCITDSGHPGVKGWCGPYSRRSSSSVGRPCPTQTRPWRFRSRMAGVLCKAPFAEFVKNCRVRWKRSAHIAAEPAHGNAAASATSNATTAGPGLKVRPRTKDLLAGRAPKA